MWKDQNQGDRRKYGNDISLHPASFDIAGKRRQYYGYNIVQNTKQYQHEKDLPTLPSPVFQPEKELSSFPSPGLQYEKELPPFPCSVFQHERNLQPFPCPGFQHENDLPPFPCSGDDITSINDIGFSAAEHETDPSPYSLLISRLRTTTSQERLCHSKPWWMRLYGNHDELALSREDLDDSIVLYPGKLKLALILLSGLLPYLMVSKLRGGQI